MAEAANPKPEKDSRDHAGSRPVLIHDERADNSTLQITITGSDTSRSPLSLQNLAQQVVKMDSDTDFSDFECNTFAKRVLHSPRIGMKKDAAPELSGSASSNQSTPEPWEHDSSKHKYSFNLDLKSNSSTDGGHISAHSLSKSHIQSSTLSEASSYDSNTDTDTASEMSFSPLRSGVAGTYGKLAADGKMSPSEFYSDESVDELVLNRLPGENLGLVFAVEGGRLSREPISSVIVKEVDANGVAYRKGIRVGDKILEINGIVLNRLSHDECVSVIQEMPLQILLHIKRVKQQRKLTFKQKLQAREKKFNAQWEMVEKGFEKSDYLFDTSISKPNSDGLDCLMESSIGKPNSNGVHSSIVFGSDGDDSDFEEGFTVHEVCLQKSAKENLGLSVVPSYGATRNLYQIKRLLPSGVGSRSGHLKVGDRLLSCNGRSLRGVTQSHCLNVLKSSGEKVTLKLLRQIHNDTPMEISVTMSDLSNVRNTQSQSPEYSEDIQTDSTNNNIQVSGLAPESTSQSEVLKNINSRLSSYSSDIQTSCMESTTNFNMSSPTSETQDLNIVPHDDKRSNQSNNERSVEQPLFDSHISSNQSDLLDTSVGGGIQTPKSDGKGLGSAHSYDSSELDSMYQTADSTLEANGSQDEVGIPPPMEFADTPLKQIKETEDNSLQFEESVIPVTNIDDLLSESETESTSAQNNAHDEFSNMAEKGTQHLLELNGDTEDFISHSQKTQNSEPACDLLLDIGTTTAPLNDNPDIALTNKEFSEKQDHLMADQKTNDNLMDTFNSDMTANVVYSDNNQFENILEPQKRDEYLNNETENLLNFDDQYEEGVEKETKIGDDKTEHDIFSDVHTTEVDKSLNINESENQKEYDDYVTKDEQNNYVCKENHERSDVNQQIENMELQDGHSVSKIGVTSPENDFFSPGNITSIPVVDDKTEETDGLTCESKPPFITVAPVSNKPSITTVTVSNAKEDKVELGAPSQPGAESRSPGAVVISVNNSPCDSDHTVKISTEGTVTPVEQGVAKATPSKRKQPKISVSPIHIPVPSMPAGENNSDVIIPLCMKTNEKGIRVFEEGSAPVGSSKTKVVDESAKRNLATILLDLSSQRSVEKHREELNVVDEEQVVPECVSRKEAAILMTVFEKWLQGGSEKELSPFKKLVSGVIEADNKEQDKHDVKMDKTSTSDQKEERSSVIEKVSSHNGHIVSTVSDGKGDNLIHKTFVNVTDKPKTEVKHQTVLNVTNKILAEGDHLSKKHETEIKNDVSVLHGGEQHQRETTEMISKPPLAVTTSSPPSVTDRDERATEVTETKTKPTLGAKISSPPSLESSNSKLGSSSLTRIGLLAPVRPISSLSSASSLSSSLRSLGPSRTQFSVKTTRTEYPRVRQEEGPFQVDILKGIVGLGIKIKVSPDGFARVTEIQSNSPVARNGNVKVGDIIVSINTTELTGQSDGKVQQILRLLPRGLAKIVVSPVPPSGQTKHDTTSDRSEPEDMSYYPGKTSPFGVRLGAKPFSAAESQSGKVTSPLSRDKPFFKLGDKKTPTSPILKEAGDSKHDDHVQLEKQALFKEAKPVNEEVLVNEKVTSTDGHGGEKKTDDSSAILQERNTSFDTFSGSPVPKISPVKPPVPKARNIAQETNTASNEQMNVTKDSKMKVEEVMSMSTDVKTEVEPIIKSEPIPMTTSESVIPENLVEASINSSVPESLEPKSQRNPTDEIDSTEKETKHDDKIDNLEKKPTDEEDDTSKDVFIDDTTVKAIPAVPPKPKGRKSLQEVKEETHGKEAPKEEFCGVKKSHMFGQSKDMDPIVEVSTNGKVFTEVRVPAALKPRIHAEVSAASTTLMGKPPKIPPAVPPKPHRKSSASSDISTSSMKSDGSHSSEEPKTESRTRTLSNRSDASFTLENVKAEMKSRRYSSSSSSSSRFEDATSEDETSSSRLQERLGKFEDLQSSESHSFLRSKPGKKRRHSVKEHMAMFESMQKQEEVQLRHSDTASRKSLSYVETSHRKLPDHEKQDETEDTKLNAALSPRFRGLHSGSYIKSVPERMHVSSSSAAPVSLTKPTALTKLKGLVVHTHSSTPDSGSVAQSTSPQGLYTKTTSSSLNSALTARKISSEEPAPVKINSALAPRKPSRDEIKIFTAKPFKAYSSGGTGSSSTGLSGKVDVDVVSTAAPNDHSEIDVVQAKTDHSGKSRASSSNSQAPDHTLKDSSAITAAPSSAEGNENKLKPKHISSEQTATVSVSSADIVKAGKDESMGIGTAGHDEKDSKEPSDVLDVFVEKMADDVAISAISNDVLQGLSDDVNADNVLVNTSSPFSETSKNNTESSENVTADLLQQVSQKVLAELQPTTDNVLKKLSADVENDPTTDLLQQLSVGVQHDKERDEHKDTTDVLKEVSERVIAQYQVSESSEIPSGNILEKLSDDVENDPTTDLLQQLSVGVQHDKERDEHKDTTDVLKEVSERVIAQYQVSESSEIPSGNILEKLSDDVENDSTTDLLQKLSVDVQNDKERDEHQDTTDVLKEVSERVIAQYQVSESSEIPSGNILDKLSEDVENDPTTDLLQQLSVGVQHDKERDEHKGKIDVLKEVSERVIAQYQVSESSEIPSGNILEKLSEDVENDSTTDLLQQLSVGVQHDKERDEHQDTTDVLKEVSERVIAQYQISESSEIPSGNILEKLSDDVENDPTTDLLQQLSVNVQNDKERDEHQDTTDVLKEVSERVIAQYQVSESSEIPSGNILEKLSDDVQEVEESKKHEGTNDLLQQISDDMIINQLADSAEELSVTDNLLEKLSTEVEENEANQWQQETADDLLQQVSDKLMTEAFSETCATDDVLEKLSTDVEEVKASKKHHILETITDAEPEADNVIDEVSMPQGTLCLEDVILTETDDDQSEYIYNENGTSEITNSLLLDLKETVGFTDDTNTKPVNKKAESSSLLMFLSGMETAESDVKTVTPESHILSNAPSFHPYDDEHEKKETSELTTTILESLNHEVIKDVPTLDPNHPELNASVSRLVQETIEAAMEEIGGYQYQNKNKNESPEEEASSLQDNTEDDAPPPPLPGSAPPPLPTSKPPEILPKEDQPKGLVEDSTNNVDVKIQNGDETNDDEHKDDALCSVDVIDETMVKTEKVTDLQSSLMEKLSELSNISRMPSEPKVSSQSHSPDDIHHASNQLDIDTSFSTQKEASQGSTENSSTVPSQLSPMSQSSDSGVMDIRNTSVDIDADASASETLIDEFDAHSPSKDEDKKESLVEKQQSNEEFAADFDLLIDFNQTQKKDVLTQLQDDVKSKTLSADERVSASEPSTRESAIKNSDNGANITSQDSLVTQTVTTSFIADSDKELQPTHEKRDLHTSDSEVMEIPARVDDDKHIADQLVVTKNDSMPSDSNMGSADLNTQAHTALLSHSDISPFQKETTQESPAHIELSANADIFDESQNSSDVISEAPSRQVPTHIIETSVHETVSDSHDSHAVMMYTNSLGQEITEIGDTAPDPSPDPSPEDEAPISDAHDLSDIQVSGNQELLLKENDLLPSQPVDGDASKDPKNQTPSNAVSADDVRLKHSSETRDISNDSNTMISATIQSRRRWKVLWKPEYSPVQTYTSVTDGPEVSVVSPEEMKSCVDAANKMMDRVGQSEEDEIKIIVLKKTAEVKAGIELQGGVHGSKMISKIIDNGLADKSGLIHVGDYVWSVCGQSVDNFSTVDLNNLLEIQSSLVLAISKGNNSTISPSKADNSVTSPSKGNNSVTSPSKGGNAVNLQSKEDSAVISRENLPTESPASPVSSSASASIPDSPTSSDVLSPVELEPGVFDITMNKGVTGVGFCLEGGLGSPRGNLPITIKRIFKGGPADKCGHLKVKDEIMKVNDIDFTEIRHYEAWNHLKFLPDGPVHLIIRRKP